MTKTFDPITVDAMFERISIAPFEEGAKLAGMVVDILRATGANYERIADKARSHGIGPIKWDALLYETNREFYMTTAREEFDALCAAVA